MTSMTIKKGDRVAIGSKVGKMKELKVGDKIVVRGDIESGQRYGGNTVNEDMLEFAGEVLTVTAIDTDGWGHAVAENGWYWTDEMLNPVLTELDNLEQRLDADDISTEIGSVVVIRSVLKAYEFYGNNDFVDEMRSGKYVTIESEDNGKGYRVEEDGFRYTEEMIDIQKTLELQGKTQIETVDVFKLEEDKVYRDINTLDEFRLGHKGQLERNTGDGFKMSNLRYKSLRGLQLVEIEAETEFPQIGDRYYYVAEIDVLNGTMEIDDYIYEADSTDDEIEEMVGLHETFEEAEQAGREMLEAVREIVDSKK